MDLWAKIKILCQFSPRPVFVRQCHVSGHPQIRCKLISPHFQSSLFLQHQVRSAYRLSTLPPRLPQHREMKHQDWSWKILIINGNDFYCKIIMDRNQNKYWDFLLARYHGCAGGALAFFGLIGLIVMCFGLHRHVAAAVVSKAKQLAATVLSAAGIRTPYF